MLTASQLNTIVDSLPNISYIYGFRLLNGRDVIISTSPPIPEGGELMVPPFVIDDTTETLQTVQPIQLPSGAQIKIKHFISVGSIVDVLTYTIPS
jgi:hypothetical protein